MKSRTLSNLCLPLPLMLLLSIVIPCHAEKSKEELETRIDANLARLEQRQENANKAIPAEVLAEARGIVILNSVKAGFIAGAEIGNGVALVRDSEGSWSAPAFVSLMTRSLGFQAGADNSVTIICLMTEESLRLLHHGGAGEAGIDIEAAAGPLGFGGEISSITMRKPVLVYTSMKGAYAGASVQGGAIVAAKKKNAKVYGQTMEAILFSGKGEPTPAGRRLIEALKKNSKRT